MKVARDGLAAHAFDRQLAGTIVRREGVGVCALISPWNWPIQTPVINAISGIAAGGTMVLKPSDAAPASGVALAEVMHAAGVPPGVFNLVIGRGSVVGDALSRRLQVGMVSLGRIDHGGHQGRRGRGGVRQAGLSGTGRQVGQYGAEGRRSGESRAGTSGAGFPTAASPAMRPAGCWCTHRRWIRCLLIWRMKSPA